MTLIESSYACRAVAGYCLLCAFCVLAGISCGQAEVAPSETKAAPSNVSIDVKPAETEAKPADTKPVGKEIVAADGPALKSITPPDGAIYGGILNDLAISLPKPEYPAAAKAEKVSGTVTVEVMISDKGEVVAASVVSGPQLLWNSAGVAARQARFDPPLKDGKPVKVAGVLTFDFDK